MAAEEDAAPDHEPPPTGRIDLLWSLGDWQALACQDPLVLEDGPDRGRQLALLIQAAVVAGPPDRVGELLELSRRWDLPQTPVALALLSGMDIVVARKHAILGESEAARAAILRGLQLLPGDPFPPTLADLRLLDLQTARARPVVAAPVVEPEAMPVILMRETVDHVLADFPVNDADGQGGFALAEAEGMVFCGYYDREKRMVVARRDREGQWTRVTLDQRILWDSHNYVAIALDETGVLHVCGNMHVSPLVYFRGRAPFDISGLVAVSGMTGDRENRVSYPRFLRLPNGRLCFGYRDGTSGSGAQIINAYDTTTALWTRLSDRALLDGEDLRNAYPHGPLLGPDHWFHMCWVWRHTPDAETTHRLCYARSRDLVHWETGLGRPVATPIRFDQGDIIDDVPVGGGIINNNNLIGFDANGRVLVVYHKYDADGRTQIHLARLDPWGWTIRRITDWSWRWSFAGRGSLHFALALRPPYCLGESWIVQEIAQGPQGQRSLILDSQTLDVVAEVPGSLLLPALEPPPGMKTNITLPWDRPTLGETFDCLVWQSLPESGDRPPGSDGPAAGQLELLRIRRARLGKMETGAGPEGVSADRRPIAEIMRRLEERQEALEARIRGHERLERSLEDRLLALRDKKR